MFKKTAEYYDKIYAQFKDYEEEAEKINTIIQREHPEARTILDVACGTGEHARILYEKFGYQITGVDLDEKFIEIARTKIPSAGFHNADMSDFSLGEKFDVVMCLFSSIGYIKETNLVVQTLKCFKKHLEPDGIVIVEPWLTPADFIPGRVHLNIVDDEDIKIVRMTKGDLTGNISRFVFEYLIGTGEGIRRETEVHELALFSVKEMLSFFDRSGFKTKYDPVGLFDRGLYLARPI